MTMCELPARIAAAGLVCVAAFAVPALPAFPGAEGWGCETPGGRGGKVIHVTTLDPDGPGSLQEACDTAGPRIVIFDVSGVIRGSVFIEHSYITLAGQTAPGAGITIGGMLASKEGITDVVIRHLRVRPRPSPETLAGAEGERVARRLHECGLANPYLSPEQKVFGIDAVRKEANESHHALLLNGITRLVLDHVSCSWGADEVASLCRTTQVTVQWCTIEEGTTKEGGSNKYAGYHNFGLFSAYNTKGDFISVHHTLFAHNARRNPSVRDGFADIRNNVVYNFRGGINHDGGGGDDYNYVGNVFKYGPDSFGVLPGVSWGNNRRWWAEFQQGHKYFVEDNLLDGKPAPLPAVITDGTLRLDRPIAAPAVTAQPAAEAYGLVLAGAGAFPHDAVTRRTVDEVRAGTGAWGRREPEGGLLAGLTPVAPPQDTDRDGMPDTWERGHGLDPAVDDSGKVLADGYTAIEVYINERAAHVLAVGLVAELASHDASARIVAAQALMAVPTPPVETVPALIAALGDDYHVVRHAAAEALGRIGAPAASALARALGAADFYTRRGAARALRVAGPADEAALPALQTALRDSAFDVRSEATHALAHLGPSEAKGHALATACEDHDYLVRRTAMAALARDRVSAAVVVPTLLAALGDGDDQVRSSSASALAGVGAAAVPEIARRLASGDSAQVRTGVTALGVVGRETAAAAGAVAVPTLIRMLTGGDRAGAALAARALGIIGPAASAATPDLLKAMLRDVESTRRQVASIPDAYIRDRTTRYAIRDSEATRALGAMGAAAVAPLLELLRGEDALTRRFAMDALGRVGPAAEPAVPEMVAYLRAEADPGRRANLMLTIAGVGDGAGEAVPALVAYLGGTGADDVSGRYAAQALAQIGAKAAPALIAALRHPDALVRQRAASALGSMAPNIANTAREALRAATRDADPAVAAAAGEALKHLEGDTSRPTEGNQEP